MTIMNARGLEEKLQQAIPLVPEKIVKEIRDFLHTAEDAQLSNINPFRFASQRKLDRIGALKAFLHLTKKGLFNLYWTVHCPSCKGITQQSEKLLSLQHASHCDFCDIKFDAGFDRSIEVSFGVNPAIIQPKETGIFARASAAFDTEPGINIELDPGESHYLQADMKSGNTLVFVIEDEKFFNIAVSTVKAEGLQKLTLDYTVDNPLLTVLKAKEGKADVVLVNSAAEKKSFLYARMIPPRWPSAALVASLQEFRDLFSSEMLSLDESFSIESLAFLFTDIKGSTELYERLGDSEAFFLVKEHFSIMEKIVARNNGGVVKTIGDAVMAVFVDPRDALRSAVEMIEAFDDFKTANLLKNSIIIKVGIHHGPCIAVTLNERIDYFGTTVNIAARVQGLSDGRDIMASDAIFGESDGSAYLQEKKWKSDSFLTSLKGLKNSYTVHKLTRPIV